MPAPTNGLYSFTGKASIGRLRAGPSRRGAARSTATFAPAVLHGVTHLTFPEFRRIESTMPRFRAGSACFACLLFALIVGLPVLAYASPPDPSWGHGVYDDADFDDIVCLIIASSGLVEDICAASPAPHFTLTDAELPPNERSIASSSPTSPQPRAPPAS